MATQSALTGHLVLSTLHTNDAAGAIPRLMNMGIEPFLITSSLNVVMAQRLVRKICQSCRKEINLPQGIRTQLEADIEKIAQMNELDARRIKKPITFYQGAGCSECGGKGYLGRIGIYEVLPMSDSIADLTIERVPAGKIADEARRLGMLTLYQDGLLKAINGITTIDEVLRESTNK
jgi:type II secretory ATPase GspE/PulE/Tfp pilus assembly ATPase PilB-like protein